MSDVPYQFIQALQSIAQEGLAYARDPYDQLRYKRLQELMVDWAAPLLKLSPEVAKGVLVEENGYRTPKIDLRGAAFDDEGRILLVRERSDGKWCLPGGWADVGEPPRLGVERELYEETGYHVAVRKLAAVHDSERHQPGQLNHTYKFLFICDITGGSPKGSLETAEVAFFEETRLPELSLHRSTPKQIALMFRHHRDSSLPTEVD